MTLSRPRPLTATFFSLAALLLTLFATSAWSQEAAIRKNLAERMPAFGKIDQVSKTAMKGLYEVRVNDSDIFYTDADGSFLIQGNLYDTKAKRNLTEERVNQLGAIDFNTLPLKDAFTIVRGNGKRKLAVFEDPNCGYCKRFEQDLQKVNNVTIYMFLYPVLGADSIEKSRVLWCDKDKVKAWEDHMVRGKEVTGKAICDTTAIDRNIDFGRKYKITGTPTLFFVDGARVPGAIPSAQVEKLLADAK